MKILYIRAALRAAFASFCFTAFTPLFAGATANPGVLEIDSPGSYRQVAALSDVHGMYAQTFALLKNGGIIDKDMNWVAGKTLLIVVGDSIDKGPDSVDMIDLWIHLAQKAPRYGGKVVHLLGNHEAQFLADPKEGAKATEFRDELHAKGHRIREFTHAGYPRGDYLLSMPVAARVGRWLFCHSGLLPDSKWEQFTGKAASVVQAGDYSVKFLLGDDSILEADNWWDSKNGRKDLEDRLSRAGLFGVVFGHRRNALGAKGRNGISDNRRLIKIDNGMPPQGGSHPGSLLVFPRPTDLNTMNPPMVWTIPSGGSAKELLP